jgi:hypothetical protein
VTRRTKILAIGAPILFVASTAIAYQAMGSGHKDTGDADATLCATEGASVVQFAANQSFSTARITAGTAAAEMVNSGASPHPWDQEAPSTIVIRCEAGAVEWLVDNNGHVSRVP